MMAKVKRMRPETIRTEPSQSIFGLVVELRFSIMSEGIVRYAVRAVTADRMVPIQKYHPHVVYSAVMPAKKVPIQHPMGALAPYILNIKFFLGPGR
jgi:hypothetical protein